MIIGVENNYPLDKLTRGSHKNIIVKCDKCGEVFKRSYKSYNLICHPDTCRRCTNKITANRIDVKQKQSKISKERWGSKEYRKNISKSLSDGCKTSWTDERKKNLSINNPMKNNKTRNKVSRNGSTQVAELKKLCEKYNYIYIDRILNKRGGLRVIFCCDNGHIQEKRLDSFRKGAIGCYKCSKKISTSEKELLVYVQSIYNGEIITNDRTQIVNPLTGWNLELDIWLPELNKAIEFNGTYWHSLPRQQSKDKTKKSQCKEKGITLMIIHEKDWNKNRKKCLQEIKMYINA